ncbi:MAG: 3-oxoacyl-ACP synthase [Cyclobacteriaceae bacterium]|nr:3-oxoacyl-ACP synthase [Cyclobacteriaceae bacterium]
MHPPKAQLLDFCRAYVQQRIDTAQAAIVMAQASARDETKSSAGDKYETGRAMMQLEVEKNMTQLAEAKKLSQVLEQVHGGITPGAIRPGSVVTTSNGNFFLAISAGQCTIDGVTYWLISPGTPIGMKMMGMKEGDSFTVNQRSYQILQVQ